MVTREVNVIYQSHYGEPYLHYQGDDGSVYMSNARKESVPNVFTGWYANNNPRPEDSALILEPIVVSPNDYDVGFLSKFKKVFTWCSEAFPTLKNTVQINYPSYFYGENPNIVDSWFPWENREKEIVIVANAKHSDHPASIYNLRVMLADLFYNSGIKVSWFGTMPLNRSYYKGRVDNKAQTIAKFCFSLCSENTYDPVYSKNYMTEKLPDSIFSGTVPMYMGCYNIDSFNLPEHTYIDLRKFVTKNGSNININPAIIDVIKNYGKQDYELFRSAIRTTLSDPNGLCSRIVNTTVYKKMLEVL
jgi:hypothetical protein